MDRIEQEFQDLLAEARMNEAVLFLEFLPWAPRSCVKISIIFEYDDATKLQLNVTPASKPGFVRRLWIAALAPLKRWAAGKPNVQIFRSGDQ